MFIPSEVTNRYINCLNYLKASKQIPSIRQYALAIGIHPQCISDIIRGKRDVNSDIIHKSVTHFDLNLNYIYKGIGDFLNSTVVALPNELFNTQGIAFVSSSEQSNYVRDNGAEGYLEGLPKIHLTDRKYLKGDWRAFEVSSDRMSPLLNVGEQLICDSIAREEFGRRIRHGNVYVVVTNFTVFIGRIQNLIKNQSKIIINLDNPFYPSEELYLHELKEVWEVRSKVSVFVPTPKEDKKTFSHDVDCLKETISNQGKMINSLNATIEKLLKQNRAVRV